MHSLGKSAKWPSYDSLSSTPSLPHSESEHTEDEADLASSEGEGECRAGSERYLAGRGAAAASTPAGFPFPGHSSDKPCRKSCPAEASPAVRGPSPGAGALGPSSVTPGDTAFAQKCADMQRFVRPLIDLLNGLKRGRFEKGLTGFQQTVAIDRLQRILGILQKPDMGEKYLRTIVQVEILLRMWFPQMVPQSSITPAHDHVVLGPSRWRQNQLHIPVKKRKMSWLNLDPSDAVWPQHQQAKRHQSGALLDFCHTATSNTVISARLPGASTQRCDAEEAVTSGLPACELTDAVGALDHQRHSDSGAWKRLATSSSSSPPPPPPASPRRSAATQDGAVSSSSAVPTADSP